MKKGSIGLKNRIKHQLINIVCSLGKRKNEIILESFPDFSCNTYELFRYMMNHKMKEKYRFVWILHDDSKNVQSLVNNVECIPLNPKSVITKFKTYYRKYNARAVISCNSFFPKFTGPEDQLHFYLDHGSQLKDVRKNGGKIDIGCDYYFSQSTFFIPFHLQQYTLKKSQIVCTGLPRYDQLYRKNNNMHLIIPDVNKYKKIIIWVPTFRKHYKGERIDCNIELPYGVPLLHSKDDVFELLDVLRDNNTLLIIKPHPAQDISGLQDINSDYIKFIYNDNLLEKRIQIDELLTQTDAMITDYSSIYYDYLELGKPIAITLDDYDDYSEQKGFVFSDPKEIVKGDYLFSIMDLSRFINDVYLGRDNKYSEREKVRSIVDDYYDDKSTQRVAAFIEKRLEEQHNKYL